MLTWIYSLVSVTIVSSISLLGVLTLGLKEKSINKILIYFVSFSAGALLGDVFVHLIPEVYSMGATAYTSLYFLLGIMVSFLIEKIIIASPRYLNGPGILFLEFGYNQKLKIEKILKVSKFSKYEFYKDQFGKYRYLKAII